MSILLGTSGWSYDSWVGSFYPESYREKKGMWLQHYAHFFPTVELASTSFKTPDSKVVDSWIKKTSTLEKFEFSLVLPYYISQHLLPTGDVERIQRALDEFEEKVMAPLYMNDRLGMVLFELSHHYTYDESNFRKLVMVLDLFKYLSYNYAVEFQDISWLNANHDNLRENVIYHLKERNISLCMIDGENFPFIPDVYSENIYFKLYGRNKEAWEKVKRQVVSSQELFDYDYSDDELKGIARKIGSNEGKTVRAYFKNHTDGQAPKNAMRLAKTMELPFHKEKLGQENGEAWSLSGKKHDRQTRFDDFD